MEYTIYKITNNVNGRIYIGCHRTNNINDRYMGSGKLIKQAIQKYGSSNFKKEILETFDNPEDMFNMEEKIVNDAFVNDQNTYNLCKGGCGDVWSHFEKYSPETIKYWRQMGAIAANIKGAAVKGSKTHCEMLKNDPEYYKQYISKIKKGIVASGASFLGRTHTKETKQKMRNSKLGLYDGEKNPNFGKCWIYSLKEEISKSIDKSELRKYLEDGWIKGRKIKFGNDK